MPDLTIKSGETLPQICIFNGSDDAPVRRMETIVCGPDWIYSLLWVPGGWVFVLFLMQMTQQQFRVTYYLSNAGWAVVRRRRMILWSLFGLAWASLALGAIYKNLLLCCLWMVVIQFGFWFEKT